MRLFINKICFSQLGVFAIMACTSSLSALAANAGTIPDYIVTVATSNPPKLVLRPPANHHFNLEAPKSANLNNKDLKLLSSEKTRLEFALDAASRGKVKTKAFICDDANTYCVRKIIEKDLGTSTPWPATRKKQKGNSGNLFIVNQPEKALAQAKAQNKPLMIQFFAIWCPPCNQLDETVFSTEPFATAAQSFVLLKLDADKKLSWTLKAKYNVEGYPTVIFAKPDGTEISRIVGAQPVETFTATMAKAALGQEWKPALAAGAVVPDLDPSKDSADEIIAKAKAALAKGPISPQAQWQAQDLWAALGEAYKQKGQMDLAKDAFANAASIYESLLKALGTSAYYNRGYNLELAYCLAESGKLTEAEEIYQRLRRRYPKEFTFHYALSRFMQRQGKWSMALIPAKQAYRYSYGDNRLRAGLNLAKVYSELGSKADARKITKNLLAETPLPESTKVRTHRYLNELRQMNEALADN
jgi:thioredoxin-like negative regulator of GroEL